MAQEFRRVVDIAERIDKLKKAHRCFLLRGPRPHFLELWKEREGTVHKVQKVAPSIFL